MALSRIPDPYRPLSRGLILLDLMHRFLFPRLIGDLVRVLERRGARSLLDICCGTGYLSCSLARKGFLVTGLDLSPTMVGRARGQVGTCSFLVGDAARMPLRGPFDASLISLALHEMDPGTRWSVWREAWRVIRPGGVFLAVDFTAPRSPTCLGRVASASEEWGERRMGRVDPPHYAHYREFRDGGGLEAWFRSLGVEPVLEGSYLGGTVALFSVRTSPASPA